MKSKHIDYSGQTIGKLKVLERAEDKINCDGHPVIRWKCQCECGLIVYRYSAHLKRGRCRCINCKALEEHQKYGYKDIRAHHWYNIKKNANNRNIEFDITMEYVWEIFKNQNEKCALSGIPIKFALSKKDHIKGETTASLDRINSDKGYVKGNVQWVHKWVNLMKNDFTILEFVDYCQKVVNYQKEKYEVKTTI